MSDLENDVRDDGDRDSYSDENLSGHSSDEGTSEQEREITVVPPSPRPSARFYGKELPLKRRLNFPSSQSDDTLDKLPRGFSSFANIPPLRRVTSRSAEPPCKKTKAAEDTRATSLSSGRASNTARRSSSVSTGKDHTDRTKSTPSGRSNAAQRSIAMCRQTKIELSLSQVQLCRRNRHPVILRELPINPRSNT